jgi:NAD(P)-dependent dehydrogenase (short-subunit alcohol dehydrogenase family)
MSTAIPDSATQREPELVGQTVVAIGGSAGIGHETARRARAEGAEVILTGRNPERLQEAADEVGAMSTAAFDATDAAALKRFFDDLADPIDHVMVTGPGPSYVPMLEMDADQVLHSLGDHVVLGLEARRDELRSTLPTGRVVEPADVAALAVHLMINTAVTGATYDIDGGQQFVPG